MRVQPDNYHNQRRSRQYHQQSEWNGFLLDVGARWHCALFCPVF